MTLRKQTLLFFSFSLLCLLIVLIFASSTIFLQGFATVEKTTVENDLKLTQDYVQQDIASLAQLQQDWANWDDSYKFVIDENNDFIDSNLNDATLVRLNLRLIICNYSGQRRR